MSMILLFLILCCGYAAATEAQDTRQSKRGIPGHGGLIGIPSFPVSDYGQPWLQKYSAQGGLHGNGQNAKQVAVPVAIQKPESIKTIPIYIARHVILERPVPVPQPVYIEKAVPVEKVVEKIVHKAVPVPVPVPQPVPVAVKQPVAVAVQQPYPVPVPIPVPAAPAPVAIVAAPDQYAQGYVGGHFYPSLSGHYIHDFGHGHGYGFGEQYGHGHGYVQNNAHGH